MKIAIVNDLPLIRETLSRVVKSVPAYSVCWIAQNGAEAVEKCQQQVPDLILMDLVMPVLDGVEATRQIMAQTPCPILIVTSSVDTNAPLVFQAMGAGALDAINTPILDEPGSEGGAEQLLTKIRMISVLTSATPATDMLARKDGPHEQLSQQLIAIGASSGGPQALARLLSVLPEDLAAPVVIVQHVDRKFVQELAHWLSTQTQVPVYLARSGGRPSNGNVYIACTNDHLVLDDKGRFAYTAEPRDMPYRPSVDVFFNSLVANWQGSVIGVLLTGMGSDGAVGLLNVKNRGWHTIVQDKVGCAVYGMPKAAAELGAAQEVIPIANMGEHISRLVRSSKKNGRK